MITKQTKKNQVQNLSEQFSKAKASFLVHCVGLKVEEMTILRKNLKQNQGDIKVIRNTLACLALKDHETVKDHYESLMDGANAFVFAYDDPVSVAKVIHDISSSNEIFKIKAGMLDGNFISSTEVEVLSKLPPLDSLRAQFLSLLSMPMTQFVRVLQAVPESFARVIKAKEDKG